MRQTKAHGTPIGLYPWPVPTPGYVRGRCPFPAPQSDTAAPLGMSVVHTHRTLQSLEKMGLATLRDGQLAVLDWDGLAFLAEFEPECFRPQSDPAALAGARPCPPRVRPGSRPDLRLGLA